MHRQIVDVLDQLGMFQPDMPRLRSADGLRHRFAYAIQLLGQLRDGEITTQDGFIADDQADHVRMLPASSMAAATS